MKTIFNFAAVLCISMFIVSCSEDNSSESNLEPESQVENINTARSANYQIILDLHNLYLSMRKTRPDLGIIYSLDENGVAQGTFMPNYTLEGTPEMVCGPEETIEDLAECVTDYVDQGICLVVASCLYCAYETECPPLP